MKIALDDGRTISAPLAWYPRLLSGTPEERENFELIGDGEGMHWPDLDEDISVEGVLAGPPFRGILAFTGPLEGAPGGLRNP